MNYVYYLLGYEEEEEADKRQTHLKHLLNRQIERSHAFKLKKVSFVTVNNISSRNRRLVLKRKKNK
jgi:hypothetical protein